MSPRVGSLMSLRTLLSLAGWATLAWLLWPLWQWAVVNAVWHADADACQSLARQGACWGVVVAKGHVLLWGLPGAWGGLPMTLALFTLAWLGAWPVGLGLALARQHGAWPLRMLATAWIECVRGVPLVSLLFVAAFLMPLLWPPGQAPSLFWRAAGVLLLFSAAYLAEIVRGGMKTVALEQAEAATMLGLGWWSVQARIVLPQALRAMLPALTGHSIGLLKDTSLVMVIGLHELTGGLSLSLGGDPHWRPFYFEAYLFVGAVYALVCLGLSVLGQRLERRWTRAVI